jgi:hypothetical protein
MAWQFDIEASQKNVIIICLFACISIIQNYEEEFKNMEINWRN